ncbi:hypothetical protein BGZ72_000744 [Mortierella alpina]|nr:hypothetical protein BGZ72_000744 [Mortierella alpina]
MSPTTIHSIVEIPELATAIARCLTSADVANALATCKAWSEQLRPFLWTNLCLKNTLPRISALEPNMHLIRTLDLDFGTMVLMNVIGQNDVATFLEALASDFLVPPKCQSGQDVAVPQPQQAMETRMEGCKNLRRIKMVFDNEPITAASAPAKPTTWNYPQDLFYNNSNTLTHLHLEVSEEYLFELSPMVQSITALIRLQHLTLRSSIVQKENWFLFLMRACLPHPRLSELYCDFVIEPDGGYSSEDDMDSEFEFEFEEDITEPEAELKTVLEEAIAARTSVNGSIDIKMKALRFPDPKMGDIIRIVVPILMSDVVEIETLEVPKLLECRPEELYETIVRKHCSALRHLTIPKCSVGYFGEHYPNKYSNMVCNFIRGAIGLKTVRGDFFIDDTEHDPSSRGIVWTLAKHHAETLEELELMDCVMVTSAHQQAILSSCNHLKRFWIQPKIFSAYEYDLKFEHILESEWVCLGLKEFSLTLSRHIDIKATLAAMRLESSNKVAGHEEVGYDDLDQADKQQLAIEASAWAAKQVYTRIGRLVALQTLALGVSQRSRANKHTVYAANWDLTLAKGYLADLAGLKNLRQLHLRTNYWVMMGQVEVEFMDARWPFLDHIGFGAVKGTVCELRKQPHWQWLQQKRPQLRFIALVEI